MSVKIESAFQILKECNEKLHKLNTHQYRFVAWLIYSVNHNAFIAGVDLYTNNGENEQVILAKAIAINGEAAIQDLRDIIIEWHEDKRVPLEKLVG